MTPLIIELYRLNETILLIMAAGSGGGIFALIIVGTIVGLINMWKSVQNEVHPEREWGPHLEKDCPENRKKWRAAGNKYGERLFEFFKERDHVHKDELKRYAEHITGNRLNELFRIWTDNYLVEFTDSNKNFYRLGRVLVWSSFKIEPEDLNFPQWCQLKCINRKGRLY